MTCSWSKSSCKYSCITKKMLLLANLTLFFDVKTCVESNSCSFKIYWNNNSIIGSLGLKPAIQKKFLSSSFEIKIVCVTKGCSLFPQWHLMLVFPGDLVSFVIELQEQRHWAPDFLAILTSQMPKKIISWSNSLFWFVMYCDIKKKQFKNWIWDWVLRSTKLRFICAWIKC